MGQGAFLLAIAAIALDPPRSVVTDRVAAIEINSFYDGAPANLVFDQAIYWRVAFDGQLHADDYRILQDVRQPVTRAERLAWQRRYGGDSEPDGEFGEDAHVPWRIGGRWVSVFWDGRVQAMRRVVARAYLRTWTLRDPEQQDRTSWPESRRAGLSEPAAGKNFLKNFGGSP